MSDVYPLRPLYTALRDARKATKALIRDDIAPATERRGPFTYPSQESVQQAWHTAEAEFGLLLLDQGQEQDEGDVLFAWVLVHVESGVSMPLELSWPMFAGDDLEEPHARAACWSHAWRHLVCHLLGIRIVAPTAPPWTQRKSASDMPPWSEAPTFKVSPVPVEDYSLQRLAELCGEWSSSEGEADRAAGRPVTSRGLHEAWDACVAHRNGWVAGQRPAKVGPPNTEEEKRRLFYWLLDKRAGLHEEVE